MVSSHDPELRSMSYDTNIAEVLLTARRLREDERPSGRGRFVNLWRAPRRETDATGTDKRHQRGGRGPAAPLRRTADWR